MATIIAETDDGYIVEMSDVESRRVFAGKKLKEKKKEDIAKIYKRFDWLENSSSTVIDISNQLMQIAENLKTLAESIGE